MFNLTVRIMLEV